MVSDTVRTRFAPSPTGYLHIGGVRTALFNWLFARRHGGRFVLRVDDTDAGRNVEGALAPILHGFRWLGLDWDEGPEVDGPHGPYYQSQKVDRYREAVRVLVEKGLAYSDFATPEELQEERRAAEKTKTRFIYSRRWMAESAADRRRLAAEGRPEVVRLKMPREGTCRFADRIRGDVEVEWAREQDHVIQRADGTCLYHLASVVDDHDMRITHVIRAEEHLSNTPRQIFIARGLGHALPEYAHLPFVAEPGSKNKLSKRKLDKYMKNPDFARLNEKGVRIATATGLSVAPETFSPVVVDFYEQVGFLPEAVVNYLLLLGWALDDRTEEFTRDEMVEAFSLERVNRAAASFDPAKLVAFQARYMRALAVDARAALCRPFLQRAGLLPDTPAAGQENVLRRVVEAAGERIEVAGDILDYREFFVDDEALVFDDRALDKRLLRPPEAAGILARFRERLQAVEPFEPDELEGALKAFIESEGLKIGQVIHALRVAVTGKAVGFGMYDTLAILGRESCLRRIDRALERAARRHGHDAASPEGAS